MDKLGIGRRLCQLDLGAYFSFCFEAKGWWGDWRVSSHPAKLEERSEREIDISLSRVGELRGGRWNHPCLKEQKPWFCFLKHILQQNERWPKCAKLFKKGKKPYLNSTYKSSLNFRLYWKRSQHKCMNSEFQLLLNFPPQHYRQTDFSLCDPPSMTPRNEGDAEECASVILKRREKRKHSKEVKKRALEFLKAYKHTFNGWKTNRSKIRRKFNIMIST